MALSLSELDQLIEFESKTDPFQTWKQRDDQMFYRCLYVKHDPQLLDLVSMYNRKLERLKKIYDDIRQGINPVPVSIDEALAPYESKIIRCATKLRDVNLEIRGRELDIFKRDPIGTTYYIDLDNGNDSNDGLSPDYPWLTIGQYTTVTSRSPGDIAWVRANTDEIPSATILFDEDGNNDNPIFIIGCSAESGNDPWGDASDVKPIIEFNGTTNRWELNGDDFWEIRRLGIRNSANTGGQCYFYSGVGLKVVECKFYDYAYSGAQCVPVSSAIIEFEDCEFVDNNSNSILCQSSIVFFNKCTWNGGAGGTSYGLRMNSGFARLKDCSLGVTTPHGSADFILYPFSKVIAQNCIITDIEGFSGQGGEIFWEDCDVTGFAATGHMNQCWRVEKETSTLRPSGGPESAKVIHLGAWGGIRHVGSLGGFYGQMEKPIAIWGIADVELTISMYIRSIDAWSAYPTASQLYLVADYFDTESGDIYHRGQIVSDEVISDASSWVEFQVTLTPQQTGWIYLDVILAKYESGKGIYVDITPIVS